MLGYILRRLLAGDQRGNVWFARRDEIARFWLEHVPAGRSAS